MSEVMKKALTDKSARNNQGLVLAAAGDAAVTFSYWA
jgi:hypothetical protein